MSNKQPESASPQQPSLQPPQIIIALDVPNAAAAEQLVERIGPAASFYKIGLELFAAGEGIGLLQRLAARGLRVFADFKFFDIPATVGRAAARIADAGGAFLSVHGQDAMLSAAVEASRPAGLRVLAITALTSFSETDMQDLGFRCSAAELAVARAQRAVQLGCAGAVCSAQEAAQVRAAVGPGPAVVTPAIRPAGAGGDDQARAATIAEATRAGASHVVVGRPVRDAADPAAAVRALQEQAELAARG